MNANHISVISDSFGLHERKKTWDHVCKTYVTLLDHTWQSNYEEIKLKETGKIEIDSLLTEFLSQ